MWSVDDSQIVESRATSPSKPMVDGDPSPWDQLPSSLIEPDLTMLDLHVSEPARDRGDPAQVYAAFWGEIEAARPASRSRRWARWRGRTA